MQRDACANVDVCSSSADISGCKQPVSKSTVAVFAARTAEVSSVYDRFTGGATDSDKVGVCLLINDNGMNINSLSALPSGSFMFEIQVNPISMAASCCLTIATFSVVNRESGLEIHHGGNNSTCTGTTRCPSCTCMSSCRTPTHSYTSCVCRPTRSPPVILSFSDRWRHRRSV